MTMADKTLACRDCSNEFVFTSGEQEFYASKGFSREPTRCPDCRAARKREKDGGYVGGTGGTYTSGGATGGQPSGGGGGGGYERRERRMYTVTCADCNREAEVPFQPRGDRPVYCSDCFRNHSANRF